MNSLVYQLDERFDADIVTEQVTHHLHQRTIYFHCLLQEFAQVSTTTDHTRICIEQGKGLLIPT